MADNNNEAAPETTIKWTNEMTILLIDLRKEYDTLFTKKRGTAAAGWTKIAEMMGFTPPSAFRSSLTKKWANLTQKYRDLKNPPTGISTEDDSLMATNWPYYEAIDSFMSERHNINPPFLIDSSSPASPFRSSPVSSSSSSSSIPFTVTSSLLTSPDPSRYIFLNSSTSSSSPDRSSSPFSPPQLQRQTSLLKPSSYNSQYLPQRRHSFESHAMSTPMRAQANSASKQMEAGSSKEAPAKKQKTAQKDEWLEYMKEQDQKELEVMNSMKDILKNYFEKKSK